MTNNLTPWIVLGLIVVVSLYAKGYFRFPGRTAPAAPIGPPMADAPPLRSIPEMTSHELALLMAQAARREAEQDVSRKIALEAADKLKATFSAPFSAAGEPAPADPKPGA